MRAEEEGFESYVVTGWLAIGSEEGKEKRTSSNVCSSNWPYRDIYVKTVELGVLAEVGWGERSWIWSRLNMRNL